MEWNDKEKKRITTILNNVKVTGDVAWYKKVVIPKIVKNKSIYKAIANEIGCPLAMVPLIHTKESGSDLGVFKIYLGNGQPYNKKTTIVPKGRGPFGSFTEGAIDALKYKKIDKMKIESLEHMLFVLEGFNGYGYRQYGINSPYIYSHTSLYTKGLFVSDGVFDKKKASENIGCLALYKLLCEADDDFFIGATAVEAKVVAEPPVPVAKKSWIEFLIDLVKSFFTEFLGKKEVKPALAQPDPTKSNILQTILTKNPSISAKALAAALKFKDHKKITNKHYIYLVDMDKYDYEKRGHLIDMTDFSSTSYLTAHGTKSDTNKDGKPEAFGNISGSKMSSLGAMKFIENYVSAKKDKNFVKALGRSTSFNISRRIEGLETALNGNVKTRGIVFHDGDYVSAERAKKKNIGDSEGCFVLPLEDIKKVNPLVEGCLLYSWHESLDE
jgi:lysozyme family protein